MRLAASFFLVVVASTACAPAEVAAHPRHLVGAFRALGKTRLVALPRPILGAFALDDAGKYRAPYGIGTATLTLEPLLQKPLVDDLATGRVEWGATVILDIDTGAVLALAESSEREPGLPGAALRPLAPAASVFKIVTASALLRAGVDPSTEACGRGGKSRIMPRHLVEADDVGRCVALEDAVPYSENVIIAKLASRFLTPEALSDEATRFGFGRTLAFEGTTSPSLATIPSDDPFAFATTAAGFGEVRLSALHGAVIAAVVGSGGFMIAPRIVESAAVELTPWPRPKERILDSEQAELLQSMLTATVSRGTAWAAFHGARRSPYGRPAVIDVAVAGKTGSLTEREIGLDTSWFVGFAPAQNPRIAMATVVINDAALWHVRALDVATRAIETFFRVHPEARGDAAPIAGVPSPMVEAAE